MTEKKKEYLRKHFKNTKNDTLMERLEISHSKLHRFARQEGLRKTSQFMRKMQRNASQKAREVNDALDWPPKGYIIPKSEQYRFKKGVSGVERLGVKGERKRIERAQTSRNATIASERRRILFGLEQNTSMKLVEAPPGKNDYRYRLIKRGYITEARASNEFYYDDETDRSDIMEKNGKDRFRFRFYKLKNKQENE